MNNSKQNEDCQHDEYCSFAKSRCSGVEGYMNCCNLKISHINDLPLLKMIKERVQRDTARDGKLGYA